MATLFWTSVSSTDPSVGANWSTASAPVTGDDVYIVPIPGLSLANISFKDMSTVTLNSLTVLANITIGTVDTGSGNFFGYWKISATTWTIGTPDGSATGSGRIKLDFGSVQYAGTVLQTGTATDTGYQALRIKGTHASNTLTVLSGSVGVATNLPGEASTVLTTNVSGGAVTFGSGVTWTTANASGGTLAVNSAGTTLTTSVGAVATSSGSGLIGTINCGGTNYVNNRPGGVCATNVNLLSTGTANFSGNPATGTVTLFTHYRGGTFTVNPATPSHITTTTYTRNGGGTTVLN